MLMTVLVFASARQMGSFRVPKFIRLGILAQTFGILAKEALYQIAGLLTVFMLQTHILAPHGFNFVSWDV